MPKMMIQGKISTGKFAGLLNGVHIDWY